MLGTESEGMVEVLSGLAEGETVVVSSQFLIDSDANLRAATAQMLGEAEEGQPGHEHDAMPAGDSAGAADTAAAGTHGHNR